MVPSSDANSFPFDEGETGVEPDEYTSQFLNPLKSVGHAQRVLLRSGGVALQTCPTETRHA